MPDPRTLWTNSPQICIRSGTPSADTNRRYLVYLVVSGDGPGPEWVTVTKERCYDLAVRYYRPPVENDPLPAIAEFVLTGGLSKFHSARQFLEQADVLDRYEGYLFLDGDVEFGPGDLNRFFALASVLGFDLAQAALTTGSFSGWPVTLARRTFVCRETTFVEVMAPYFSQSALGEVLHTFDESISSYGLDFVWARILSKRKVGIIDSVLMHHSQPIDLTNGPFYTYLRSIGIDPNIDMARILERYGISRRVYPHDIAGYVLQDTDCRQELIRIPLIRIPRTFASLMRLQDKPACLAARALNLTSSISLPRPLPR